MKPYASYKPSGVSWLGALPEHWEVKRVKFVSTVQPSNVDKLKVEGQVEVLLCNYVDVYKNEKITSEFSLMVATATVEQINRYSLVKGDVVVTKDSESPWDIAVPTLIAEDIENLVCGYHLAKLKPYAIDSAYMVWTLRCYQVNLHFALASGGITRYGLGTSSLSDGNLPYPPTNEQKAIADYLDTETPRIDELMREKENLIGLLREYRQSIIAETVLKGLNPNVSFKPSGVPWLGEVPEHWEVERLKFLVRFAGGGTPSKDNDAFWDGDIPWVSPKDMKRARINDAEDKITRPALEDSACLMIPAGVVLMVVRSGILQHSLPIAINDVPVAVNQDMKALLPESRVEIRFLVYQIRGCHKELREEWVKQGATVESIEHHRMADSRFALPSYTEQQAISDYLDAETVRIDELVTHTHAEINLLKELRTATIADAVLGRIDVRTQVRP